MVIKTLASRFGEHDVSGLGAELAYRFLFAVFPFGLFVAALVAFVAPALGFDDPVGRILAGLGDNLPPEVAGAIRPELENVIGTTRPGLLSFGAIAALWAATSGTLALIKAMNRAYGVDESRSLPTRYLVAIGLTLLGAVGLIASFVTIVGGALVTQELADTLGLGGQAWTLFQLVRWPIVFVALVVAVAVLYRFAPNARAPWRWIFVGAGTFTLGWLVATWALGFYVSNFADYGATYGSLAGVIVLMLWFYVTSILLAVGGEVVAITTTVYQPGALEARRDEIAESETVKEVSRKAREATESVTERVRGAIGADYALGPRLAPDRDATPSRRPLERPPGGIVTQSMRREPPD